MQNAAGCAAACTADPNCYGWTFTPSTQVSTTGGGYCYLKGLGNCNVDVSPLCILAANLTRSCVELRIGPFSPCFAVQSLVKTQVPGKYTSGIIGDACTV